MLFVCFSPENSCLLWDLPFFQPLKEITSPTSQQVIYHLWCGVVEMRKGFQQSLILLIIEVILLNLTLEMFRLSDGRKVPLPLPPPLQ